MINIYIDLEFNLGCKFLNVPEALWKEITKKFDSGKNILANNTFIPHDRIIRMWYEKVEEAE